MALSDFFNNATVSTRPDAGALTAQKLIAASSITVDTTAGWPVSPDSVHFIIYQVDASGNKVAGTQTDWKGTVTSSTAIGSLTLKAGTDQIYPVGSKVIATPTGAWADDMVTGLLVAHEQDGTLKAGAVDVTAVIADGIVTRAKLATAVTTELNDGWTIPTQTVSSVTNNGNRSYDVVFNSTVASTLSPGMRLRTTRTVTAPTQCADLESGSSQYFSKAAATGFTTGTTWTIKAKVKLESYATGVIWALDDASNIIQMFVNSSGQLTIAGGSAGVVDIVTSYQSLPLGKWVDVTGSITVGTPTGETRFDDVVVPSFVTASAATTVTLSGDEVLYIGRNASGAYFDGKIAQVAVFNAIISDATLKTYSSQTMTGSETSLEGFWSLNNTLTDLSANANTLTASGGAVATNADSPFGQDSNGVTAGTTDYAIVTSVSTTTATVRVAEGNTIPTSGGVSAVAYSTATSPFGFPSKANNKVLADVLIMATDSTTSTTADQINGATITFDVPKGAGRVMISLFGGQALSNSDVTGSSILQLCRTSAADANRVLQQQYVQPATAGEAIPPPRLDYVEDLPAGSNTFVGSFAITAAGTTTYTGSTVAPIRLMATLLDS